MRIVRVKIVIYLQMEMQSQKASGWKAWVNYNENVPKEKEKL